MGKTDTRDGRHLSEDLNRKAVSLQFFIVLEKSSVRLEGNCLAGGNRTI
jgi:hypothetical protein